MKTGRYSVEEDERIKAMIMAGVPQVEIAAALDRTSLSLYKRVMTLGLSPRRFRPWTDEEFVTLRRLAKRHSIKSIARIMQRDRTTVRGAMAKLGLNKGEGNRMKPAVPPRPPVRGTEGEDTKRLRMAKEGSQNFEAAYVEAAKRNGWRVYEFARRVPADEGRAA
jgi:hypothetical protein